MKNAMTVDLEDYFQVSAFEQHISRSQWEVISCRVEANTTRILELFEAAEIKATFFALGWIAERYPPLLREISDAGHEVASHGFSHVRATEQSPEEFRHDVTRTKLLLEDICGHEVKGYRAASFSICESNLWALDALYDAGYHYSSSIYPVSHDLYGSPQAPRFPFRHKGEGIIEVPITTIKIMNRNFPCGGGGYFRLLPYALFRWALRRVNKVEQKPGVFYFHPSEIDPNQPRQQGLALKTRFRHYCNLSRMESRLERLLQDFCWGRMDTIFLENETPAGTAGS